MDGKFLKQRINLVYVILITYLFSANAYAKRWGLAAQYEIPNMSKSHLSFGRSQEQELDPNSIKVLVWNLLKAERKTWLGDFVNMAKDKDILLLQEGYMNSVTHKAIEALSSFQFDMGVSFLYKKDNNTPTGTIVGSKTTPIDVNFLRTNDLEPLIQTPKTITYATYSIQGSSKQLLAMSIHGINFTNHQTFVNQINQAMDIIIAHDGPIIFAGDFNSRTKNRLEHLRNMMRFLGLREASFRDDKRMKVLGNVLDHAFIKGMLVKDSYVLKNIKSSDHKAMVLDLVVE